LSKIHAVDYELEKVYGLKMADKKVRSVAKTFSWRFFIFVYWLIFGYVLTGPFNGASILGLGSIIPLFFYYFHERIWNRIRWGTDIKK
jgi:uncharacterized membrane protein